MTVARLLEDFSFQVAAMHLSTVSPSAALVAAAFALVVLVSGAAVHRARARGDTSSAMFAAVSALLLAALLAAVVAHERAAGGAGGGLRRGQLKAAAWALSAALTGMFAHRVAALAPAPSSAILVWGAGAATAAGGFYCLFVHDEAAGVVGVRQQGA
ncbi:hypothetical protein ACP70R_037732 [Stipagrostis hirtigluma subsp. patula]